MRCQSSETGRQGLDGDQLPSMHQVGKGQEHDVVMLSFAEGAAPRSLAPGVPPRPPCEHARQRLPMGTRRARPRPGIALVAPRYRRAGKLQVRSEIARAGATVQLLEQDHVPGSSACARCRRSSVLRVLFGRRSSRRVLRGSDKCGSGLAREGNVRLSTCID
jgi:hypothetical protein